MSSAVNETLATVSNNFMYSAMVVYAGAMLAYAAELAFGRVARAQPVAQVSRAAPSYAGGGSTALAAPPRTTTTSGGQGSGRAERLGRVAVALTILAFGLHLASVVTRGLSAHRVPWGNMYEFSTAAALAVTAAYLVLLTRQDARFLGLFVVAPVLVTLGVAVTVLYTESAQLVPALKSYWLVIHVSAAVISSGIFTVGAVTSVLYLVADAGERRGRPLRRLPAAAALDRTAYRIHAFGFPLWTFAVIAGAIWAENAWGRYWGWDPKETWAFITWVVYAAYLHARATAGWRGRAAAAVALVGYACFTFNYFGVNIWISGLHSYAGV